jgi:hypothetical protein
MMAATHMVVAGAAGRVLRRPWLAWPAGFASYFVLDAIPHLNPEQFVHPPATEWVLAADVALGVLLVVGLSAGRARQGVVLGSVLCAALAAVLTHRPHLAAVLDTGYLSAIRRHSERAAWHVSVAEGLGMQAAFFIGGIMVLSGGGHAKAGKRAPARPPLFLPALPRNGGGTGPAAPRRRTLCAAAASTAAACEATPGPAVSRRGCMRIIGRGRTRGSPARRGAGGGKGGLMVVENQPPTG